MGSRHVHRTAVETWIEGYLKLVSSQGRVRQERKFIEKSIVLINRIFGHPCCDEPTAVVSLITPNDNQLTHTIIQLLDPERIIRRSYRLSLFRILALLNTTLYGCCTEDVTIIFDGGLQNSTTVQFTDIVTGDFIASTELSGTTEVTLNIPTQYLGPAALVQICLNNSIPNGTTVLTNGTTTFITNPSVGQVCDSVLGPITTSYIVQPSV